MFQRSVFFDACQILSTCIPTLLTALSTEIVEASVAAMIKSIKLQSGSLAKDVRVRFPLILENKESGLQ